MVAERVSPAARGPGEEEDRDREPAEPREARVGEAPVVLADADHAVADPAARLEEQPVAGAQHRLALHLRREHAEIRRQRMGEVGGAPKPAPLLET
jgi:hypothetical protein